VIGANQILPFTPVVCSANKQFARVDRMEGSKTMKLMKDEHGQHHYIPLSWVISTENYQLKINRSGEQAMKGWANSAAFVDHETID
jgi:hypothetical protein